MNRFEQLLHRLFIFVSKNRSQALCHLRWKDFCRNQTLKFVIKIFVEKFSDIDAIVADQNNFIDENFDAKFQRLVEAEILPKEMAQRLTAYFADENKKTMHELFQEIHSIGVELDMPNFRIEKIINKAIQMLN